MNASVSSLDFPVKPATVSITQRKFHQWILKRIGDARSHDTDVEPTAPSLQTLAGFLQTIGFELFSVGKHGKPIEEGKKNVLRVTIECGTSSTKAVLELEEVVCQCSNSGLEKDVRNDTGLPGSTESIARSITDLTALKTGSQLEKPEIGVTRSHTQPEMRLHVDQKTWNLNVESVSPDEEPRPWPPKMTSSPAVIDLSASLGQISLDNDTESPRNVIQFITGAQKNLEKALKMLLKRKQSVSSDVSSNRDQDAESVKSAPANMSPENSFRISQSSDLNMTRSLKLPTRFNYEKSTVTKLSNIQSPKARRNIESTMTKSLTRRSLQIEPGSTLRYNFNMISSMNCTNVAPTTKAANKDSPLKTTGSTELKGGKVKSAGGCDLTNNKGFVTLKKSSEQGGAPSVTNSTPNRRTRSLLKPPTKISISKPVSKLNPTINAGLAARRSTPSRE